jgi:nuclear protein localization family protein 4
MSIITIVNSKKFFYRRLGKEGWTMKHLIADFHFLLFLCNFMDIKQDIPRLCQAVVDLDQPLDEGYQLLIRSIADM